MPCNNATAAGFHTHAREARSLAAARRRQHRRNARHQRSTAQEPRTAEAIYAAVGVVICFFDRPRTRKLLLVRLETTRPVSYSHTASSHSLLLRVHCHLLRHPGCGWPRRCCFSWRRAAPPPPSQSTPAPTAPSWSKAPLGAMSSSLPAPEVRFKHAALDAPYPSGPPPQAPSSRAGSCTPPTASNSMARSWTSPCCPGWPLLWLGLRSSLRRQPPANPPPWQT